ncbi:MAG: phosphoglycerate kinase [Thermodesulfobacteriota bacterium]
MKNIRDIDIKEKRVLIRVDFNVPLDGEGRITDDTRIRGALPTIEHALAENARVILCSHLGRPKGQRKPEFSLAPAAARLAQLLGRVVRLAPNCVGPEAESLVMAMRPGDVVMLENLRFHPGEQKNDPEFSRQLAALAEIYVNDAFAVSHREDASVVGVTRSCPQCAAGLLLQKEMDFFHRSVSDPVRPLAAIIGGAKVSGKLTALINLMDKVDIMIIGGAMANTFLKSQGHDVGRSLVEDDLLETARNLLADAAKKGVKLYLPVDFVAAAEFTPDSVSRVVPVQNMPAGWMALDIGPATTTLFGEALADARTILWNGPMGAFEMDAYARGTMALVQKVATSHALSIVGGGDTNAAVHKAGWADDVSYMSTGGGAFLMLMEGKELPGVAALTAVV